MHFPFWACGIGNPVHALGAFNIASTDASVLILFSQCVLSVWELQEWVLDETSVTFIYVGLSKGRIPFGSPDKSITYTCWEAKHCDSGTIKRVSFLVRVAAGGDIDFLSEHTQQIPVLGWPQSELLPGQWGPSWCSWACGITHTFLFPWFSSSTSLRPGLVYLPQSVCWRCICPVIQP